MWKWIKKVFSSKYKDGKNFTKKEKKECVMLLKMCRRQVLFCKRNNYRCRGLCPILEQFTAYGKLTKLYYNRGWLVERIPSTMLDMFNPYWWNVHDYNSRLKAIKLLKEAIIND